MILDRAYTHQIQETFEKARKQGEAVAQKHRDTARLNERYVNGDQFGSAVYKSGNLQVLPDDWFDDEDIPRLTVNKLQSLRMVWTALMNKSRVSAKAWPATDEPEDSYRAEVANKYIEYFIPEQGTAKKTHVLCGQGIDAGTAALKVIYEAAKQKVTWTNVSIFDYLIDPCHDYNDARWVIFERWLHLEEAEKLWETAQLEGSPKAESRKMPEGEEIDDQVRCWELWHKPCRDYPEGLYAFLCGSEVVEATPYPYAVQDDTGQMQYRLPIFIFKVRDKRGSAYGGTNLTDCIMIQRTINELNDRQLVVTRKTSGVHAWVPAAQAQGWDPAVDSVLPFSPGEGGSKPEFLQPPVPNPSIEKQRLYYEQELPAVMGLNDLTTGDQVRSMSGVALESVYELDTQKNADAAKSLEECIVEAWAFTLYLIAYCYPLDRQIKIANATASDIVQFTGSDIQGVDIRLEVASEVDKMGAVKETAIKGEMAAGTAGPADLERARMAPTLGMSRQVVEQMITAFLQGQTLPDPRPGVDFSMVVFREVMLKAKARALKEGKKEDWIALRKLEMAVEQAAAEQGDAMPTPDAQPRPTGPTNPQPAQPAPEVTP